MSLYLMVAIGVFIVSVKLASTRGHVPNDPQVKAQLQDQFADQSWSSALISAGWGNDKDLDVVIESTIIDERATALRICLQLTAVVAERYPDGELWIYDSERDVVATNFLANSNRCYWRGTG